MSRPPDGRAPLKVLVLGVRGLPHVQGGVEMHCEQLYPRIAALGCDVEIIVRSPFTPRGAHVFGAVRLRRIWAPRRAGVEALVHSFLGVLYAAFARPDVLHIHAIGPAIVAPLARLFGLKVVVTHHGPDYDRDKWSAFARRVLRTGERAGMRAAHARIAISQTIAALVHSKYGLGCTVIPNGVVRPDEHPGAAALERFAVRERRYFLQVSRLVPEKRQLDLITAFRRAAVPGWKLVLVGGIDGTEYAQQVAAQAGPDVIVTGFLTGAPLQQVLAGAGAFVLPSTHEGLPIAMLEALAHGLPVLASDIAANVEVGLPRDSYFAVGDVEALAAGLARLCAAADDQGARDERRRWVAARYDWARIASQTLAVYRSVLHLPAAVDGGCHSP